MPKDFTATYFPRSAQSSPPPPQLFVQITTPTPAPAAALDAQITSRGAHPRHQNMDAELGANHNITGFVSDDGKRRLPWGRVTVCGIRINLLSLGDPRPLKRSLLVVSLAVLAVLYLTQNEVTRYLAIILAICAYGSLFAAYLAAWVLRHDDGTAEMRGVSDPIREGAEGFLVTQYAAILNISLVVAVCIFISFMFRDDKAVVTLSTPTGIARLSNVTLAITSVVTFFLGAGSSAAAGWVSMALSAQANVRVTSAACTSYAQTFLVCFRAGAFSAMLTLTLCVAGLCVVFGAIYLALVVPGRIETTDVPLLLVGFGFGSSFVALFMQLGGGIFTKASDVGADLSGKIDLAINEDDCRNPAVISDLVGDIVGDCIGSNADLFETLAAEVIGTMILGSALAKEARVEHPVRFIFFPIFIHAFDIVVSALGVLVTRATRRDDDENATPDPMVPMYRGYMTSLGLSALEFVWCCYYFLHTDRAPNAWLHYAACGMVGILTSFVFVACTNYYTDYKYAPVREIAAASVSGHGTNVIAGLAMGMKATAIPSIAAGLAVIATYHLGRSSGLGLGHNAGLMGTAVGTMGMLSSAGFVLSANNYGPIADNAGGISEMSRQPDRVRHRTDLLDAAGNVTKAITKGYSIGSAAMACFVLFGAFMDEFSEYAHTRFAVIDIGTPEVLIGGLLGTAHIFYFTGLAMDAVAKAAQEVVKEVRRQYEAHPEIIEWKVKPDYFTCVQIVTKASLREMVMPGVLAVLVPVVVGVFFRLLGESTDRPMLGAEVLGSFVMFATVTGILMALFLDTAGGAWDNAKKYIELGNFGGKGSDAHKASVTGDTVGDPSKDTAGPALHVAIKLINTAVLILAPLFVGVVQQK